MKVDTIENMVSVRDIGWEEGSDHITITTDDQVINSTEVQNPQHKMQVALLAEPKTPLESSVSIQYYI